MKITVYSTQTCPYCVRLKEWLNENKIEFENKDVGEDNEAAKEMVDKSGQMGVPVTIIEKDGKEEIITGFDKEKLEKILKD